MTRREFAGLALAYTCAARPVRKDRIDDVLRNGITQRRIPAAVGMAANRDGVLYSGAFGTRDSTGVPVMVDSIFQIASMTKAVTSVAAMQLVEQGRVSLDAPASKYLPKLADLAVYEGVDANGKPRLRPARVAVTLRHLLTHTSGFCYDNWDATAFEYSSHAPSPAPAVQPLMFEPGTRWQYGTGVDWAGRIVEAVSGMNLEEYFQTKILRPLEMHDTSYILSSAKFDRMVARHQRQNDGSLQQMPRIQPPEPKEFNGGGGLYSTAGDYVKFMQMVLGKGRGVNRAQILSAKTVESMEVNQIGASTAGKMKSFRPNTSSDVDMQAGAEEKWGLGFLINTTPYAGGRSAGSLAWAGLYNTFFWIDPKRGVCATLLMQFLPFVDRDAVGLLGDLKGRFTPARDDPPRSG
jgi:CubicO group peptidase (beta-lactamase class C family)